MSSQTFLSAFAAAFFAFNGSAGAQEFTYGQSLFVKNCAVCHGAEGAGDGPVAELFEVKPKNLRKLESENNGAFPFSETYQAISGPTEIKGHGSSQMPIWGELFEIEMTGRAIHPGIDPEELVQARILALVYFLQSVQE